MKDETHEADSLPSTSPSGMTWKEWQLHPNVSQTLLALLYNWDGTRRPPDVVQRGIAHWKTLKDPDRFQRKF